jgi:hypothetical protein
MRRGYLAAAVTLLVGVHAVSRHGLVGMSMKCRQSAAITNEKASVTLSVI